MRVRFHYLLVDEYPIDERDDEFSDYRQRQRNVVESHETWPLPEVLAVRKVCGNAETGKYEANAPIGQVALK